MNRRKIIVLALIACTFLACTSDRPNVTVKGKFSETVSGMVYLYELTVKDMVLMDSAVVDDDGSFRLRGRVVVPGFASLQLSGQDRTTLILFPDDKIRLEIEGKNLTGNIFVSGSEETKRALELNRQYREMLARVRAEIDVYRNQVGNPDIETIKLEQDAKIRQIISEFRQYARAFVSENPGSFASLMALFQQFDPYTPVFDSFVDMAYFEKVDSALMLKYPASESVKELNQRVNELKNMGGNIRLGQQAPEIALPSPEGDTVLLSSFRGQYVLLDFWASWCNPCRMENPHLVNAHKRFGSKGFTIFQVSLDKTREAWTAAIRTDSLQWAHVSDLKFWASPVANIYNIKSIPTNFLLDREGRIIARDLRGVELERTLEELLN